MHKNRRIKTYESCVIYKTVAYKIVNGKIMMLAGGFSLTKKQPPYGKAH